MKKKNKLTLADKAVLRSILRTILCDDDLLRGFRNSCVLTTREIQRVHGKLDREFDDEVGAILGSLGG